MKIRCFHCSELLGEIAADAKISEVTAYVMGLLTGHFMRGCSMFDRLRVRKAKGGQS